MISKDTNPSHWKLLICYYNPENPRLFVAKRSGLPWTLNFAKPAAWVITGLVLVGIVIAALLNN